MKHVDFEGKELNIGDSVIFMQKGYRNLMRGKIVSLANAMCKIEHEATNVCDVTTKQYKCQVVKCSCE